MIASHLSLFAGLVVVTAPVAEPLGLDASPSSAFLIITEPGAETSPLAIRLGSGFTPVRSSADKRLNLVTSTLDVAASLSRAFILDGELVSRSILNDALASIPDRMGLRLRYLPAGLASNRFGLSLMAGGSFGSDLKWDKPGPGVGAAFAGFSAGGAVSILRYAAQLTAGWGLDRGSPKSTTVIPIDAGAGIAATLPALDASLGVEASARVDLRRAKSPWALLGAAGLTIPVSQILTVHLAATATRNTGRDMEFGGVLAIAGKLGLGDLDGDGIPDSEDACPDVSGTTEYFGCPFEDRDGDGVWDRFDACPEQAGPAANAGCPLEDSNHNGVPDIDDPCPGTEPCPTG
jgi:hypothetical protein